MTAKKPLFRFCNKCQTETDHYEGGGCKPCVIRRSIVWQRENKERHKLSVQKYCENNKEKVNEGKYEWARLNPEKVKNIRKKFYDKNQEQLINKSKLYRKNNLLELREKERLAYKENKSKFLLKGKLYREKNVLKLRELAKNWASNNKKLRRVYQHNRTQRKKNNGGNLSSNIVETLMKLQKGKCVCCGESLKNDFHIDHIIPLALGGMNSDDNVQLLRSVCNLAKSSKHPVDFMQERGFLI